MPRVSDEPPCGRNLPPGCLEGDPRAPWNAPAPWEGGTCGGCRNLARCRMLDGTEAAVCAAEGCDLVEVDPGAPACEGFA